MRRLLLFLVGLAALAALAYAAGLESIARAFATLGLGGLVVVALIHLPLVALLGWAFRQAAGAGRLSAFIGARLVRDAAGELLPFSQLGGFAAGARVLSLFGIDLARGSAALFTDLIAEFIAKLPYTAAGLVALLLLRPDAPLARPVALGLLAVTLLVVAAYGFRSVWKVWFATAAHHLLQRWGRELPPTGHMLPPFVVHTAAWFAGAVETWVTLRLLGHSVSLTESLVIDSLANGLRTFAFFIPAAAGVQEAAYVVAMAAVGIGAAPALALSLVRRARDLVVGLPALASWHGLETRRLSRS